MIADTLSGLIAEDLAPQSSVRTSSREGRGFEAETTPVDTVAVGKVLDGKYRVERKIGEGAMGVVLAATHLGLDEVVAIKFIRPEVQLMEGTLARFAKEAKIAARIRSEHVAKVLDVGVLEPLGPFIVMEYLEGESLADLLEARLRQGWGPLAADRVVEYALQACEALAAAHAIGVIHRDVKPDNLFVTRHGGLETLKLLDFGISKAALTGAALVAEVGTSTLSFVMGTPLYMSPEQLRSSPDVDSRSDVWSMGAVMYELLSGEPPFLGESIPEICAAILGASPPALACSAALEAVVLRCLEKDPARRFQTVADLATALVPLAPGEARAYASRTSGILRASALKLGVGPAVFAMTPEPARAVRTVRFHSSALVAAATVLALSALGITMTVAKLRGRAEPSPRVTVVPSTSIALTVLPPFHDPGIPRVRISPVPMSEPAPPIEPIAIRPSTPRRTVARAKGARSPTRAPTISSAVSENSVASDPEPNATPGDRPQSERVRLGSSRARLRFVNRGGPAPGAASGTR